MRPELYITLGRHEFTDEEGRFVRAALMARVLNRISTALKVIMTRVEHAISKRRERQSWGNEGTEFQDLQRLTHSLTQRYNLLYRKLAARMKEIDIDG